MKKTKIIGIAVAAMFLAGCCNDGTKQTGLQPVSFESVDMRGELAARVARNFDRLEMDMYQPDSIFKSQLAKTWPGDAQGRVVLGLVVDSRSSKRTPLYLEQILAAYPDNMNEQGYFGPLFDGILNEQQLSGNGWVLRGLCEYYEWTRDEKVLAMITNIVDNLFMKGKGMYSNYPIDPADRKKNLGDAIGDIVYSDNEWILSSDIGCIFIGMEGMIHAYKILGREDMREVIEEMMARFLEIDLVAIKAQTHASLTACRGLIRYAEITGRTELIEEAAKRWELYCEYGMTENYENYNWFERYNTWSEPCAVVDSYMVAMQLWKHTRDARYIDQAELIYYNGLCHSQRFNGGFGCDFGPGEARHSHSLEVRTDEAHWCCTMRGAEGLASAVAYSYFTEGNAVYVPFYHESSVTIPMGRSQMRMSQTTQYPFDHSVRFEVEEAAKGSVALNLRLPVNTVNHQLVVNGEPTAFEVAGNFAVLNREFAAGDVVEWNFEPVAKIENSAVNAYNTKSDQYRAFYGVLLLGNDDGEPIELDGTESIVRTGERSFTVGEQTLTTVYHLMDPEVWSNTDYHKQMLF